MRKKLVGYCLIVDKNGQQHRFKSEKSSEIFKFIGNRKDIQEIPIAWIEKRR